MLRIVIKFLFFLERKFENNTNKVASHILTETTFASFKDKLSEATLKAVDEMGFAKLTEIQEKTLPTLLEGKNLMAAAKTGSGKTLAFLIAAIEFVHHVKYKTRNGELNLNIRNKFWIIKTNFM